VIAKRFGFGAGLIIVLGLCVLGLSALQGDCGGANVLDRVTTTPEQIVGEKREMSGWLAATQTWRDLKVESVSGHRLTLLDTTGREPGRFTDQSSRAILAAWIDVLQRERHLAGEPIGSVYIDFGQDRGTFISSHECAAP
jgi:hypothetical protein